ncbi:hypothetical protein KFK09_010409 [Dendrobium nobile]|uniref:Uncharacterized protein n=1 Tax=Dendrobium nobile TaxID=94219 RepID=A0A8T3B9T6_DENNO|nr:hypothetical protein KFK09_010409 [Dendrobium nobile]
MSASTIRHIRSQSPTVVAVVAIGDDARWLQAVEVSNGCGQRQEAVATAMASDNGVHVMKF